MQTLPSNFVRPRSRHGSVRKGQGHGEDKTGYRGNSESSGSEAYRPFDPLQVSVGTKSATTIALEQSQHRKGTLRALAEYESRFRARMTSSPQNLPVAKPIVAPTPIVTHGIVQQRGARGHSPQEIEVDAIRKYSSRSSRSSPVQIERKFYLGGKTSYAAVHHDPSHQHEPTSKPVREHRKTPRHQQVQTDQPQHHIPRDHVKVMTATERPRHRKSVPHEFPAMTDHHHRYHHPKPHYTHSPTAHHAAPKKKSRRYQISAPAQAHPNELQRAVHRSMIPYTPQDVTAILCQRIFGNSIILDGEGMPFSEANFHWQEKRLTRLGHVLDRGGAVRWEKILARFDKSVAKVVQMQVKTILEGVPRTWLRVLRQNAKVAKGGQGTYGLKHGNHS
eukprot:c1741_g1_i1.p1 GENE.c1741_g1_i1~~c1741_g1_i1.p1  ORF type:complete len:390 (-),score=31.89 c1741_g1_i1:691-1860(-)